MKKIKGLSFLMGVVLCSTMVCGNVKCAYAEEKSLDSIFVSESSYEDSMNNTVVPYIDSAKETGYMDVGQPNFKIYYEKYKVPNAKGNIVISHGYTESLEKYHEIIYYFMNEGYSVYGLEHRGHGRSGHLGKSEEPTQVNVDDFEDYVSDLKSFLDNIVKPETQNQKLFLFAHSMGGGIGTRFLEEYDGYFDAAILSSPMIEMNTGKILGPVASIITNTSILLSHGDEYVMNQKPYNGEYNFAQAATTCEPRYAYSHNVIESNKEIQRGGFTNKWLHTSLDATAQMILPHNACRVKIPVLLFQAEKDDFVKPVGQNIFKTLAKDCTIVKVKGSKHETYMEKDEILKPYLEKVMNFYNEHL